MSRQAQSFIAGNTFDKYSSKNVLHKVLMRGFLASLEGLLSIQDDDKVLDVGCGSGELALHCVGNALHDARKQYFGIDLCPVQVAEAKKRFPPGQYKQASAYALPFPDQSFDVVLLCEVLEHLEDPETCLREMHRVCKRDVIISVPWEPVWRVANVIRGKYWSRLGNTPGHVQHFSRQHIHRAVSKWFTVVRERRPFPWTMLLCRREPDGVRDGNSSSS